MSSVDIPYPKELQPVLLNATALNAPTSPADALYVRIPSYGANNRRQANWEPHGGTYPSVGAPCLVGEDETGQVWVLSWVGGWS